MPRSLLDTRLAVLLTQADDTRGHLRHLPTVRAALADLGFDLPAFEAELAAAVERGWARDSALGSALIDERVAKEHRSEHTLRMKGFVRELRARIKVAVGVGGGAAEVALADVRTQLRRLPRRFPALVDTLRVALPVLRAQEAVIGQWIEPETVAAGEALLCRADRITKAITDVRIRIERCRVEAEVSRLEAQELLRRVRSAWDLARRLQPGLPPMPLDTLRQSRKTDDDASAA